jgi:2'-hydroxyisoflavone reductase
VRILIIGGTRFLGRHIVDIALERGHELTLFNRGKNSQVVPAGIEQIQGDRNQAADLQQLAGRTWDAVIDPSAYFPRQVRSLLDLIGPNIAHYSLISTISVYAEPLPELIDESAPLATTDDPEANEIGANYGALKALCEEAAEAALPGKVHAIRAGLIVGPYDPTHRFTYWPERLQRGGDLIAPGSPDQPVQVIDVRDLAEWTVGAAERGVVGRYNATGPAQPLSLGEVIIECQRQGQPNSNIHWLPENWLLEQQVQPWIGLPLWLPGEDSQRLMRTRCEAAIGLGLRFRPLAETVQATIAWFKANPEVLQGHPTLTAEREAELLKLWQEQQA